MSSSAISTPAYQALAANIKNADGTTPIYSAGAWDFKNASGTSTFQVSSTGAVTAGPASGGSLQHVLQSGDLTSLRLLSTGDNTAYISLYSNSAEKWQFGYDKSTGPGTAGSFYFYDAVGAKYTGSCTPTGAWTFPINTTHTFGNTSASAGTVLSILAGGTTYDAQLYLTPGSSGDAYIVNRKDGRTTYFNASSGGTGNIAAGKYSSAGSWTFTAIGASVVGHEFSSANTNVNSSMLSLSKTAIAKDQTSNFYMTFNGSNGADGYIWNDAGALIAFAQASDRNMKENIRECEHGLKTVNRLRAVTFDWKSGTARNVCGFIAQEALDVMPQTVDRAPDDSHYVMSTAQMLPALWQAVRELSAKLDEANARIASLEAK